MIWALAVAGLIFLNACIPEAQAVGSGVIKISAVDLMAAYENDQAAADAAYKGRTVEITGEVQISRNVVLIDQYIVVVYGSEESTKQTWGVQVTFKDSTDQRLYSLEKHQVITVRGRVDGWQQDVVVRDAQLVEVKAK